MSESEHKHVKEHDGPRVPALWGSFATDVCACGWWRLSRDAGRAAEWLTWNPGPVPS